MKRNICIVIPCYKVKHKIFSVYKNIDFKIVDKVIIVDDCCPEKSGKFLQKIIKKNNKIEFIFLKKNLGVGGATIKGFRYALKKKFDIIIKIDGDGQHNIDILKFFLNGFERNKFDFCKGYRSLDRKSKKKSKMPFFRFWGAKVLEILVRLNSGNHAISDPCHGLIALNYKLLKKINLNHLKENYFFEQDLILNVVKLNGKIGQFKNEVTYGNETSSLNPLMSILPFLYYHFLHFLKKY